MGLGNLLQKILTSPLPLPLTSSLCSPSALRYPSLFGASFLSLSASVVSNYTRNVHEGYYLNHGSINVTNVSFCNVTLSYTHPGQHDLINVQAWLPLDDDNDNSKWNERLQAVGGGGWMAGMFVLSEMEMAGAIGEGYATITTDGGHSAQDPNDWALVSPGNVDLYALQNFASVSLNDVAVIGKSLVRSFYGRPPKYSYWSGCSQGGRQGLMLAQRYPTAFDGIVASAPAINLGEFVIGNLWPQVVMDMIRQYPHPCLLDALTAAAIEACDGDDGVLDGVISDPEACFFDPFTLVGTTVECSDDDDDAGAHDDDDDMQITVAAAAVANAAWSGAVTSSSGKPLWHGVGYDAILTGPTGVANTECDKNGTCVGAPSASAVDWVKLFIQKDPSFTLGDLTHQEFERYFHATAREFGSIIDTNDPDLSDFRRAGGKMLTYHGLADGLIPPKSTRAYYDAVSALDPDVLDFYRLFESPGLGHCWGGGRGGYPSTAFDSMVAWVESGIVPANLTVRFRDVDDVVNERFLCPYPQKARYDGNGDPTVAASFYCSV